MKYFSPKPGRFAQIGILVAGVLILYGNARAQFPPTIDLSVDSADVTILGAEEFDKTGSGLTSGDYNGDGITDLAIYSAERFGTGNRSFVDVLWGSSVLSGTIDLLTYTGNVSRIIAGESEIGFFASVVSDDLNNDGYDDLVLGLPLTATLNGAGRLYVVFGTPSFPDTLELDNPVSPVTTILGVPALGWLGHALATGKVDGDEYSDLIAGASALSPGGQVYIIYGRDSFPVTIDLANWQPGMTRIIENQLNQGTGSGLACKDVDKDGFDDILMGSPGVASGYYRGAATLMFGASALPDTIELSQSTMQAMGMKRFYGEYVHGQLGWQVAIADMHGDGVAELILSAPMADPLGCQDCGELYVVSWDTNLPDSINVGTASIPITRLVGAGPSRNYGLELATGDASADGCQDLFIMSRPEQSNDPDLGKVTMFYGAPDFPDSIFLESDSLVTRFIAEFDSDGFGRGLAAEDLNDDGIADVVIGAPQADPFGRSTAGKVYVFWGTGLLTNTPKTPGIRTFLGQNYPNPFNPSTTIVFSIAEQGPVSLVVYDVRGRLIKTLVDDDRSPDEYRVHWDGTNNQGNEVATGVYLYRLRSRGFEATRKMVLIR